MVQQSEYRRYGWTLHATRGIVSPKERASARQELLDHIEDHMEVYLTMGMTELAAEERALAAMGSADDISSALRRVHQPILSRLLQICRVLTIVALAATLFTGLMMGFDEIWADYWFGDRPDERIMEVYFVPPEEQANKNRYTSGERWLYQPDTLLRVGDYTIRATDVSVTRNCEDLYITYVLLDITCDHLWQDPLDLRYGLLLSDGRQTAVVPYLYPKDENDLYGSGVLESFRRRLRHTYQTLGAQFDQKPEKLTITYPDPYGGFTMEIDLKGGAHYEG